MSTEINEDVAMFLEHFGVSGMKWGHRKSRAQAQAHARSKGLGQRQLKSEAQRVREAGGGIKGTVRVRNEMKRSGELSKSDARKGSARFARNVAIGVTGAIVAGAILGKIGSRSVSSIPRSGPFFSTSGPRGSLSVGNAVNGTAMTTKTLNMLVSSLGGK